MLLGARWLCRLIVQCPLVTAFRLVGLTGLFSQHGISRRFAVTGSAETVLQSYGGVRMGRCASILDSLYLATE